MPFTRIRGTFHVVGFAPDGDSIRFAPDDANGWDRLRTARRPQVNGRNMAQLRLQGIDALETHYSAGGVLGTVAQPQALGDAARDRLLALLGITGVVLAPNGRTIAAADDAKPGYILCNDVDVHRRPIAYAFAGSPPGGSDDAVFLDVDMLRESVNHRIMGDGLAYPIFYLGLFNDLRLTFAEAADAARGAGTGVWQADGTRGVEITSVATVTDEVPLFPKLFRRLTDYFADNAGEVDLSGFKAYLEATGERVILIDTVREMGFDNIVEVARQQVGLMADPTRLLFVPR